MVAHHQATPLLIASLVVCATTCVFDWDGFDPRLVPAQGGGQQGGGAAAGGAAPGGNGGDGAAAGAGGGGGGGGGGGEGGAGGVGGQAWYDVDFAHRRPLDIDNGDSSEGFVDFPLMLKLETALFDGGSVQPNGADLRVVDDDHQTLLAFEIERWGQNYASFVWVEIPDLAAGATRRIWMYYGNPTASQAQQPAATWSNDYASVWHMDPSLADATQSGHDGTDLLSSDASGQAARCRDFPGANAYVSIQNLSGIDGLFVDGGTVSVWIRPESWGGNNLGRILDKSYGAAATGGWALPVDGGISIGSAHFTRSLGNDYTVWATPGGSIALDSWQHLTYVFNDTMAATPHIYIDGVAQTLTVLHQGVGTPVNDSGAPLRIGSQASLVDSVFDGRIDELRLSTVARTPAWIAAQYRSQNDALVAIGPQESH